MEERTTKKPEYTNIYNRLQKNISFLEWYLIHIKQNFTDNIFFYFLCIIFRFIPLVILSGDFYSLSKKNGNQKTFQEYLKTLTCHNLIKNVNLKVKNLAIIYLIIIILLICRIIINYFVIKNIQEYKCINKICFLNKYIIVIEHVVFLFFPYIIEFLSFPYYIYFFPKKFIIKSENEKFLLYIYMTFSIILIIIYNINNYLNFICSNRMNIISLFDAYFNIITGKNIKPVAYRTSNFSFYIYIFMQNLSIFLPLQDYSNNSTFKLIIKIIISIIILFAIFLLILTKIKTFDYDNFINTCINILLLFCFFSIIFDFILCILNYKMNKRKVQIMYVLFKLFFSNVIYILLKIKTKNYLEALIVDILFQEKNNKNETLFINSLYYLHQLMLKIKKNNKIKSVLLLINFFKNHIKICNKPICNCILLKPFYKKEFINTKDVSLLNIYLNKLKNILNYLFESPFVELDYCNKYELAILLSEHFCLLKNNSIMAFSLISTLIQNHQKNLSKLQLINLYELEQKYIYYLSAKERYELEMDIKNNNKKLLLLYKLNSEEVRNYYIYLKLSKEVKKLLIDYIDNQTKILKYKIIFEDSLTYKYDENNENIISVKISFFEKSTKIDNLYNNSKQTIIENKTNLHFICYLLNEEYYNHKQVLNLINKMDTGQNMPIGIIFKFFIFFDIFGDGKMPADIPSKLYNSLTNKINLYNSDITTKEYNILIKKYKELNCKSNSKHYAIFEFKRDIRTKYYSEICALKFGFKQKDIINKRIDKLMPKEFASSHQNLIKQLIIGNQIKDFSLFKNYFFDSTSTTMFSVNYKGILIYNITKHLNIVFQWVFNNEKEYHFLLNNNLDLISNSKNFELEYYLNKNIFQEYNLKLFDILKINSELLYKKFINEINNIKYQNYIRKVKTEEYFIPKFYISSGEKNNGIKNPSLFNTSKKNILKKLSNKSNQEEDINEYKNNSEDEGEKKSLIKKNNIHQTINNIFIKKGEIIFHNTYKTYINKLNFIKNLDKELSKIDNYELNYEHKQNVNNYNLITSTKKLISILLKKRDIANHYLKLEIKQSFYYDKIFYFISIDDEKKYYFNIPTKFFIENQQIDMYKNSSTSSSLGKKSIPFDKKSRNKKLSNLKMNGSDDKFKNNVENKINVHNVKNKIGNIDNKDAVFNKINEYKEKINKDQFLYIIRVILFALIVIILIIYILIVIFVIKTTYTSEKIFLSYLYNLQTKNNMLNIYFKLLQIYYNHANLVNNSISNNDEFQDTIEMYSLLLKDVYHNFTNYFYEYNLNNKHGLNIIYQKRSFFKLRSFWREINYESDYQSESDYIIYNLFNLNMRMQFNEKAKKELNYFMFFKQRKDYAERQTTKLIRLLYYFISNYEFSYKKIFDDIKEVIYNSFLNYIKFHEYIYIILEISVTILFILFYVNVLIFLYYSNEIIIKNIIFIFLDFSEDLNNKNKDNNNIVSMKLSELQSLIDDFDLVRLEIYSQNIDNINNNYMYQELNKDLESSISANINSSKNFGSRIEKGNKTIIDSAKSSNKKDINRESSKFNKQKSKKIIINQKKSETNISNENLKINNNINNGKINYSSSQNYLVESNTHIFKDKLIHNSNGSISVSKELLTNNNNNSNNLSKKNFIKINENKSMKNINEDQENIQDIILKESKNNKIFIIRIYQLIIICFIIITICYSMYKFSKVLKFGSIFDKFFINLEIISKRYNILYYYFNIFRTILISSFDSKKEKLEVVMEKMTKDYENENNRFNTIFLNQIKDYKEINEIINIVKKSKEGTKDIIKQILCLEESVCLEYINSDYYIFDSGIDFVFQTYMVQINNLYMEYKNIENKTDINIINSTIINGPNEHFANIELSLNHLFYFLKEKIFKSFRIDTKNIKEHYFCLITFLNCLSVIFSLISFLFINIFIFISLYKFTKPMKESVYRINCSFFNIKNYSIKKCKL